MSLFKQLTIMLGVFLIFLLFMVMALNFRSSTEFVQNQLYNDAKNTAHHLGLTLSKTADLQDLITIETMVSAIYDSGYYERISLKDMDGKDIINKFDKVTLAGVPEWFLKVITIQTASAKSEIMSGWSRVGTLEVVSHTGNAYRQLYTIFVGLIKTFLIIAFAATIILYIVLKLSLKSLIEIKNQALAIMNNEFIIGSKTPFTTEFRSVAGAMNSMIVKVKDIFERENEAVRKNHELLYVDAESRLYNRKYLSNALALYLEGESKDSIGSFLLLNVKGIEALKKEMGYEGYLNFLKLITKNLLEKFLVNEEDLVIRLSKEEFFIVAPRITMSDLKNSAKEVLSELSKHIKSINVNKKYKAECAIGSYTHEDSVKSILSKADLILTSANFYDGIAMENQSSSSLVLGREEWRKLLLESMENEKIVLASQKIVQFGKNGKKSIAKEIFIRLIYPETKVQNAGVFIPMAISLGLADEIDYYTIEKTLKYAQKEGYKTPYALNICVDFIKKEGSLTWLDKLLKEHKKAKLFFEITNSTTINCVDELMKFKDLIKQYNHSFGLDQFTLPHSGAGYLQKLLPDYIKANRAYLEDLFGLQDGQMKQESFKNIIISLGIDIIAMGVENKEQIDSMLLLGINKLQGVGIDEVSLMS